MSVTVIGRIELPAPAKQLYQCLCCGQFKPAKDFPHGQAVSLYDCNDCEYEQMYGHEILPPPHKRGNIEQNFIEDWISDLEDDLDML